MRNFRTVLAGLLLSVVSLSLAVPAQAVMDYQGSGPDHQGQVNPNLDRRAVDWLWPLVAGEEVLPIDTIDYDGYSYMNPQVVERADNGDVAIKLWVQTTGGGLLPGGSYGADGYVVFRADGVVDFALDSMPSYGRPVPPVEPPAPTEDQLGGPVDEPDEAVEASVFAEVEPEPVAPPLVKNPVKPLLADAAQYDKVIPTPLSEFRAEVDPVSTQPPTWVYAAWAAIAAVTLAASGLFANWMHNHRVVVASSRHGRR